MTFSTSSNSFSTPCKAVLLIAVFVNWTIPATATSVSSQITDVVSTETEPCAAEASLEPCAQVQFDTTTVTSGVEGAETIEAFPTAVNSQITD